MNSLLTMMTYRRGHDTESERAFTEAFIDPIPGMMRDTFGNRYLKISANPKTLFSAHLDSVHRTTGIQKIVYDRFANAVYKDDGEPLGADNAAGVWILINLIIANKPGLYIFHRAEECGGRGSKHIATENPALLAGIKRAVAFDRRGYRDIITHQRGRLRGCSDQFGTALAAALGMDHELCDGGSFTDTANYFHLVPECTNISVGYHNEHTSNEWLNLNYLTALNDAALAMDWDSLPTHRTPTEERTLPRIVTPTDYSTNYYNSIAEGKVTPLAANSSLDPVFELGETNTPVTLDNPLDDDEEDAAGLLLLQRFVRYYPDEAAELLADCSVTTAEVNHSMLQADLSCAFNSTIQ